MRGGAARVGFRAAPSRVVLFVMLPTPLGRSLRLATLTAILSCAPAPATAPAPIAGCRTTVGDTPGPPPDTVRWASAADTSHLLALADRCRDVGPAVVVQPPPDDRRPDSLAIVTWNLHIGAADLSGFVGDLRAGRLTDGHPVRDFVVLTQEARRGAPPDIMAEARALGLGVYYVPSMRNGPGRPGADDRGNAILSTVPLLDLEAVELPLERQRRVAILATVRLGAGGAPLRLANVHLEPRSGWLVPDRRSTGIGRRNQMTALLQTVPLGESVVLAGDLNTWTYEAAEPVIAELVETHRFTFTPLPPDEPTLVALFGLYTRQLDYVFFRLPEGWSGRSRRIADRYGSDHYPLLAWVRHISIRSPTITPPVLQSSP